MNIKIILIQVMFFLSYLTAQEKLPEFVLQNGHSEEVNSVAFSPDGKTLASGSGDQTIKLWSATSGKLFYTLSGHSDDVNSVAFSPDGKTLASGSEDQTIKLWSAISGKLLKNLSEDAAETKAVTYSEGVKTVTFSPDGRTIASGIEDGTIKMWDATSGKLLKSLHEHSDAVNAVVFSPDGKILASGSEDGTIKLWSAISYNLIKNISEHSGKVKAVTFSPDGKIFASGNGYDTINLWDITSGKLINTLKDSRTIIDPTNNSYLFSINGVAFSPDGATLAAGGNDNALELWDVISGKLIETFIQSLDVNAVAFSPDGKILVSGSSEINLWDATAYKLINTLSGHSERVQSVAFSPDGKTLASANGDDTIKLWDATSGKFTKTLSDSNLYSVETVVFSPDGKTLVSGSNEEIEFWDVASGKLVDTLNAHSGSVSVLAFSPDGKILASRASFPSGEIKLWDATSGQLINTLTGDLSPVTTSTVAFSPDGKIIASGSLKSSNPREEYFNLWDATSGKILNTLGSHSAIVTAVTFSSHGKIVASKSWSEIKLWNVASGKLIKTLKGDSIDVDALAFSRDDKMLVSAGFKKIMLWDVASGQLINTLSGHSNDLTAVVFSPDGKILASGNWDTSVRYWRVSDGTPLAISYAIDEEDYITYTPQGYYTASKEGEKLAAWRINNEVYAFEQYSEQFNRPDLVARALAGEDLPRPRLNIAVDFPPTLQWTNAITATGEPQYEMVLQFKSSHGLEDLVIIHNNQPLDIQPPTGKAEMEIRIPLSLTSYENSIRILAYDENRLKSEWLKADFQYSSGRKGLASQAIETITAKPELGSYGKKYAIVIGISDYKNLPESSKTKGALIDLKYTHKDAQAFKEFLETEELSGGQWDIQYFINENATTNNIDNTLTDILTRANKRDLIFIFFSGHGRSHPQREKDVYLLSYDFEVNSNRSGFSYQVLLNLIADSKAEHIIAFIDACRSGTIGFSKGESKGSFDQNSFGERLDQIPENKVVFSSGRGTQLSWEDPALGLSVFTHYLIKGLRGEAEEHKNPQFVDLGELAEYVQKNVNEHTTKAKQMDSQYPQLFEASGVTNEDFPIAIRSRK